MKIGFIGVGFMGKPLLKGVCDVLRADVCFYDVNQETAASVETEFRCGMATSAEEVVTQSDVIILCVKPNIIQTVLHEIKHVFTSDKLLISIAAGVPLVQYMDILGAHSKVIRAMPNQPAAVGKGMTLLAFADALDDASMKTATSIFQTVGDTQVLPEKQMNAGTAITGSSPAYVFLLIEAMADAAVLEGIPRDMAYRLAASAVSGSGDMVLQTGKHPAELKDAVCSPGGTTIEAVQVLEQKGFRAAVIDAVHACKEKADILEDK